MIARPTSSRPVRAAASSFVAAVALATACAGAPAERRGAARPARPVPVAGSEAGDAARADVEPAEPSEDASSPATEARATEARAIESSAPAERRVTIGASGDVLVHLKVAQSARAHAAEGGYAHVFGGLGEIVRGDEVAFVNLETPLSERVPPETGEPPVLGAPAEVAAALGAAGVDVVSVANNHSYDQMAAGLADTLRALDAAGVRGAGAHVDVAAAPGPVVVERDGVRVAFVAFTERVNRGPVARGPYTRVARFDEAAARAALDRAREAADVVVLSIHWSHDFVEEPRIAQRERARMLVNAGADLVLGHGAHVLQEVERLESPRGDALVAYSLGNLVSNQGLRYFAGRRIPESLHPAVVLPTVRDGVWLRTTFALDGDRIRIDAVEGVPLWTHNNYLSFARREAERLDIRVTPLSSADAAILAERRPPIAEALGDAVTLTDL